MNGLLILLASLALNLSKPQCICGNESNTVKEFLEYTDIILVGTIDTVSPPFIKKQVIINGDTQFRMVSTGDPYVLMSIEDYYYGSKKIKLHQDKAIIRTGRSVNSGECGYPFVKDRRYIVWGLEYKDMDTISVHTSICMPTSNWQESYINSLRKHRKERELKIKHE